MVRPFNRRLRPSSTVSLVYTPCGRVCYNFERKLVTPRYGSFTQKWVHSHRMKYRSFAQEKCMFRLRCSIAGSALLLLVLPARADHFDYYTNPVLAKAIEDGVLKELKELTSDQMAEYADVLGDSSAVFLIVVTNDNRHAKLLVRPARQRVGTDQQVSMILIEKYVTYKEATERTVKAKAENVHLYGDSRLHLDLGQIVPEKMGGDLIVIESPKNPNSLIVKPLNKAKLFVVTKAIANVVPKKAPKLVLGEKFEPRFFIGTYKLCDDGRHPANSNWR